MRHWAGDRDEEDILPEYRLAFKRCCLVPHLMSRSRVTRVFQYLDGEMKQRPLHRWPESMRTCMVALSVEYRNILQVFARILLGRLIEREPSLIVGVLL